MVPLRHLRHLARRFVGSLSPLEVSEADDAWATEALLPGEVALWRRMGAPDRRHAIGVARRVVDALGPARATRAVVAAALLHDVGKVESGLGTFGRVYATLVPSRRGRVGEYRRHDQLGAALLTDAGSDALTIAWAREHHTPRERWTVPRDIGQTLKAADDD